MKLWLLKPKAGLGDNNPWRPWYDKAFGFVVRAETEADARRMVGGKSGDELAEFPGETGRGGDELKELPGVNPWLDPALSTCEELTTDGPAEIVLRDFRAA